MQNTKTQRLVTTAIMLALATVLSMVKVFKMPMGGSITLLSMLPVVLLSIKYGVKWGLSSALIYAVLQLALDMPAVLSWGLTPTVLIGSIVFDYLLAFSVLGLAGAFAKKGVVGAEVGIVIVLALRFVCHVISGTIFFGALSGGGWQLAYAIAYNGTFMLPELILTMAGAFAMLKIPVMRKLISLSASGKADI